MFMVMALNIFNISEKPFLVDLHCHLNGLVAPKKALDRISAKGHTALFHAFEIIDNEYPTLKCFLNPTVRYLKRISMEPVKYIECIVHESLLPETPKQAIKSLLSFKKILHSIVGSSSPPVYFNYGCSRFYKKHVMARKCEICVALWEAELIGGFDLSGWEGGNPASYYREELKYLRNHDIPLSIHAGEWKGPDLIKDALTCDPHRIGHAVSMFDDDGVAKEILDRQTHIEMCVTSNLITKSVPSLNLHPIRRAYDSGINVSFNTDDPVLLKTTPKNEYLMIKNAFGFSQHDVLRMMKLADSASFSRK